MKATGIVRRIDDLGRVVIPKEIRRTMRIREGDPSQTTLETWQKFSFSMLDLAKRMGLGLVHIDGKRAFFQARSQRGQKYSPKETRWPCILGCYITAQYLNVCKKSALSVEKSNENIKDAEKRR